MHDTQKKASTSDQTDRGLVTPRGVGVPALGVQHISHSRKRSENIYPHAIKAEALRRLGLSRIPAYSPAGLTEGLCEWPELPQSEHGSSRKLMNVNP